MPGTSSFSRNACVSASCFSPMLVSQRLSQIERISSQYSSKGGIEDRVTLILSILLRSSIARRRVYGS